MRIAEKIYNLTSFKRQYEALITLSVCRTIENLDWATDENVLLEKIDWNNMLSIASLLSFSEKNEHLDAALRIAQTTLIERTDNIPQQTAAATVLQNLTNQPAIDLALKRELLPIDFEDYQPFTVKLQNKKINFENTIFLKEEKVTLNRFQKDVHESYERNNAISISAPTSAGKSFILYNIIMEELVKGEKNIVYLVPTRALISQVEKDLKHCLKKHNLNHTKISTVPQIGTELSEANIYVFTQERLHWFLTESNGVKIDILIVDEAHKIEDGYRGILLQQKIEQLVSLNNELKVYFSSPFTENPELLLQTAGNITKKDKINTQFISVNQNLIYTKQVPRITNKWEFTLCLIDKSIRLGTIKLVGRPTNEKKKIAYLSQSFSANKTGNVLYANGPAEAEQVAVVLYDILPDEERSEKINNLIELAKKTIHDNYRLVKTLEKRIAFHYGNIPLLVREEIERLFKEGEIKYLICTSTLLEGVNLPAKNIFIRKPTRGSAKPLNQNDFWNLAGRAGRWGKEFSGNIVCIEPDTWPIKPNPKKSKQKIIKAIDNIEADENKLIEFITKRSPREDAENNQDLEFAFSYFYIKYLEGRLGPEKDLYSKLIDLFDQFKSEIQIPEYIIKRNPGISPIAQQELWEYFCEKLDKIEEYIPVYPEDANAYQEYVKLISRIGKTLAKYPTKLNNSRAILLLNWMSGKPLSYIIKKSWEYYRRNPKYKNKKIDTVIRDVMNSVENFARFRFAKDSGCYVDILKHFLISNERQDLVELIPQLNLWLEFGVSQKTHLSLLSLGLTRNTAIALTEFISETDMTQEQVLEWIRTKDLSLYNLSEIIMEDIKCNINLGKD
ncbi:MAG: DEAD/DEAH box helicase [Candidatus Omnitrophica bacterium]|nr:DEAD/DEAH box helicase [Candidatus Omnitrophota bacterium]